MCSLVRKDLVAGLALGLRSDTCPWQPQRTSKAYETVINCCLGLILFDL